MHKRDEVPCGVDLATLSGTDRTASLAVLKKKYHHLACDAAPTPAGCDQRRRIVWNALGSGFCRSQVHREKAERARDSESKWGRAVGVQTESLACGARRIGAGKGEDSR